MIRIIYEAERIKLYIKACLSLLIEWPLFCAKVMELHCKYAFGLHHQCQFLLADDVLQMVLVNASGMFPSQP